MISAVRSDSPTFREVHFTPGFNVVLADRTKESTKNDSRNGLGKSTLIEIVHFCLGSGVQKNKGLMVEPLLGWNFSLDMVLGRREITVTRNTKSPGKVLVEGDVGPLAHAEATPDGAEIPVTEWRSLLGGLTFGLAADERQPYAPTFRGLIPFFARRGRDAYSIPFETHRKQVEVNKQVYNAFLLGLEWRDAVEFQLLKDQRKAIESLQSAAGQGLVARYVGTRGELEAVRVRLEARAGAEAEQLGSFRVHPEYEQIVRRADALTAEIHELANRDVVDAQYLSLYREALSEEKGPPDREILDLYERAGVVLPGLVTKTLSDVREFHSKLVQNRRAFLESEVVRLERATAERKREIERRSVDRAQLLTVLRSHGALEEYTRLQQLHSVTVAQLADVDRRISDLKTVEEGKSRIAIQQETLLQRARRDLEERAPSRREAIRLFNGNSEALYSGAAGSLVIEVAPTGFRFRVDIERSGSQGIENMKVFCYDMTLAQLWAKRDPGPGFLIHDSTIFDGVDERQIALGLEHVASESARAGFQYICALNSDAVPWSEFSSSFNLSDFVRLRLTDSDETGCLLGMRF